MIDRTRDVMRGFTLAALLCALAGCGESDKPEGGDQPDPQDPVEAAAVELGAAVTGCSASGFADNTLTLTLTTEPAVVSAPGGKITVNGYICTGTVNSVAGTQLTTTNVKKLALNGTAGANKVILDLLPGSFGTTILGAMGGITVDFSAGGTDSFMIRGGASAETYKFAKNMGTNDFYVEVTNDKVADIWVKGSASAMTVTASMGNGADTVIGNPGAVDVATFAGAAIMAVTMTRGITAYGGAGDDRFTGGDGDDTFNGGDGADTFRTVEADDGSDTYIGDNGSDTVDYSTRTAAITADIGPSKVSLLGTVDLATVIGTLTTQTLIIDLDGAGSPVTVTFATPANPAAVVSQINATVGLNGVASLTGKNQLLLSALTNATTSEIEITGGTGLGTLGLSMASATPVMSTATVADADDGLSGENDDIRPTTENITGGSGNDTIYGDASKNTIKGGGGDDHIMGGGNTTCDETADGDVLQGEAGNDTFWLPVANCFAQLTGGTGDNIADFSGRSVAVYISNNGVANDGATMGDEKVNVAADILKMVGGFGGDTITGGMGNDWIVGGLGSDVMSGGAGIDIVDYTARTTAIGATPCFTPAVADCASPGNDGAMSEGDEIHLVEHLKGGSGVDTFNATGATVDVTFEGNVGMDVLTGGDGNDTLWGDADADTIVGGAGDDNITGGAGIDVIQGGAGDGDICVTDGTDSPTPTGCEL